MTAKAVLIVFIAVFVLMPNVQSNEVCSIENLFNMTMEEILLTSDMVVYGKDKMHGKLRHPNAMDSRFDVYCVLKFDQFQIPGEIIIESVDEYVPCYPVQNQTVVGEEYILGLSRRTSGFTRYAQINPGQGSAFQPSEENFERLSKLCEMQLWKDPSNGSRGKCPSFPKPKDCKSVHGVTAARKSSFWDLFFESNTVTRLTSSIHLVLLTYICHWIYLSLM